MTDWAAHLGHGRRLTEPLGWLAAAAFAILLAATGASFAMWLDRRAGEGTVPDSMLLDLPPMPPAQAVSEAPTPQPDAPAAAPEQMEIAKDADGPPQTATSADTAPDLELPEDLMPLEEVAQDIPQVEPPPPVVQKAEVQKPAPKPMKKQKKVKEKAKPDQKTKKDQGERATASKAAGSSGAAAAGDGATANAEAKWKAKASSVIARHMTRKRYSDKGSVSLAISISASGAITGVSLRGSTGDNKLDAEILSQARRAPSLPPPPSGKASRVSVPVTVKR
jgi:protein TonB